MKEANPKLILLRTSGFGQTGPYAKKAGFGTVVEAMSGFTSINGEKGGNPTLPARYWQTVFPVYLAHFPS